MSSSKNGNSLNYELDENTWNKILQSLNDTVHKIMLIEQRDKIGLQIAYSDIAENLGSLSEIINKLIANIRVSGNEELNSLITRYVENWQNLETENKELKKIVEELREKQAKNANLEQENNDLKRQLQELEKLGDFDQQSVNELRTQLETIKEQKPWLLELEELNCEMEHNLDDFIICSQRTKEILAAEITRKLGKAEQIAGDLSSLEEECKKINQEVNEMESKGEQMREYKEKLDGILWGYLSANKAVAQAIGSKETSSIDQKLGSVEEELTKIDKELSKAIQVYDDLQKEKNKMIPL